MKKIYWALFSILLQQCFCVHAFSASDEIVSRSRPMLHTYVEIKAWGSNAGNAIEEAFDEMERVNGLLNNYDPKSEISNINQHAGGSLVTVSPETVDALQRAIKYGDITGGALDITVGPLLRLWGFGKDAVGLSGSEPDRRAIRQAQALVNYRAIELNARERTARLKQKGMWIDVGSFSKGYSADKAIIILKKRGIRNALVIAGGSICAIGHKPDASLWQVGIQHPRRPGSLLAVVFLKNGSISTSGDYEIFYKKNNKRRTHIIDPRTGTPVEHLQSVSVIAPDGMSSDALSTALFVLGPEKGISVVESLPGAEALIISEGGKASFSKGWPEKKINY